MSDECAANLIKIFGLSGKSLSSGAQVKIAEVQSAALLQLKCERGVISKANARNLFVALRKAIAETIDNDFLRSCPEVLELLWVASERTGSLRNYVQGEVGNVQPRSFEEKNLVTLLGLFPQPALQPA